jgi:sugar phosphate isomerase/epimerase
MQNVGELEIGVMFWAGSNALETLKRVKALGVQCGQLGISGEHAIGGYTQGWLDALRIERFTVATVVASYTGESYADFPAVIRTVGFAPPATRAERIARTKYVADFASQLSVNSLACHVGFVPEDHADPAYQDMVQVVREICDHCAGLHQTFAMETGQEPPAVMLRFLKDVERQNLKINFDPANLIMYGTGDPLEALDLLAPYIVSVHCKDGDYPPVDQPKALGTEQPLGQGSVNIPAFIEKLKRVGYRGILSIEREEPDGEKREADIRAAVSLLKGLRAG